MTDSKPAAQPVNSGAPQNENGYSVVRAQFEKEWGFTNEEQGLHFIPEIDSYGCALFKDSESCDRKNSAWYYWQKSRQAVVVELPRITGHEYDPLADADYREGCRAAIESQGLRVGVAK